MPIIEDISDAKPETTPIWKSKTFWASILVAAAPAFPPVQALIAANPNVAMGLVGAVFAFLRTLNGKTLPLLGTSGKPVTVKKK